MNAKYPALAAASNNNNGYPALSQSNDLYKQFQASNVLQELNRGQFVISSFIPSNIERSKFNGHVDVARWNQYWEQFSEKTSDHEAAVKRLLASEEMPTGSLNGAGEGKTNRRRIVVKLNPVYSITKLVSTALQHGALENVILRADEVSVQFTTCTAALTFCSVMKTYHRDMLGPGDNVATGLVGMQDSSVLVFVTDAWVIRHTESANVLVLGSNVGLPSMYVDALFMQLYDAKRTEHVNGSYVITFDSNKEARYALHSLQTSLYFVFGLTLQYAMLPIRFDHDRS